MNDKLYLIYRKGHSDSYLLMPAIFINQSLVSSISRYCEITGTHHEDTLVEDISQFKEQYETCTELLGFDSMEASKTILDTCVRKPYQSLIGT